MILAKTNQDALLCKRLLELSESDQDYWSFKKNSRREHGHGLFQYPAMMVPQIAKSILEQACSVHPEIERVGDPFVGSGTIMTESMMRGLSFSGTDINPLAVLLCHVKKGPFLIKTLNKKAEGLLHRIQNDDNSEIEANFPNIDKWFNRDVKIALSKIRRAIRIESTLWVRRFFWIVLAETVKYSSNSRTSTFKLHIRNRKDIEERTCDAVSIFKKVLTRNLQHYEIQEKRLLEAGNLHKGHYQKHIEISLSDIRYSNHKEQIDIIVTSPPYGDNTTTVPYGQYSYLPLQWIDLNDIEDNIDTSYLASTHEIDTRSLGGSKRINLKETDQIISRSPAFSSYIESLDSQPKDRKQRVIAFFRDLDCSLGPILKTLHKDGLMVWTLGNRKVGGKRVPLDLILEELLLDHKAKLLCKLSREISSKKMAFKNNIADTMSQETILIMRKEM